MEQHLQQQVGQLADDVDALVDGVDVLECLLDQVRQQAGVRLRRLPLAAATGGRHDLDGLGQARVPGELGAGGTGAARVRGRGRILGVGAGGRIAGARTGDGGADARAVGKHGGGLAATVVGLGQPGGGRLLLHGRHRRGGGDGGAHRIRRLLEADAEMLLAGGDAILDVLVLGVGGHQHVGLGDRMTAGVRNRPPHPDRHFLRVADLTGQQAGGLQGNRGGETRVELDDGHLQSFPPKFQPADAPETPLTSPVISMTGIPAIPVRKSATH